MRRVDVERPMRSDHAAAGGQKLDISERGLRAPGENGFRRSRWQGFPADSKVRRGVALQPRSSRFYGSSTSISQPGANLPLTKSSGRRQEMAARAALGGGTARLARGEDVMVPAGR